MNQNLRPGTTHRGGGPRGGASSQSPAPGPSLTTHRVGGGAVDGGQIWLSLDKSFWLTPSSIIDVVKTICRWNSIGLGSWGQETGWGRGQDPSSLLGQKGANREVLRRGPEEPVVELLAGACLERLEGGGGGRRGRTGQLLCDTTNLARQLQQAAGSPVNLISTLPPCRWSGLGTVKQAEGPLPRGG